jgi:hypothetical protein
MPGRLRCDTLDLCSTDVLTRVIEALTSLAGKTSNRHVLEVKGKYYFSTPQGPLSTEPGWYLICSDDSLPIYVGTATNLNSRLNSDNGSRDGFADPQRTSDPARNFIKAFASSGALRSLSVVAITERDLMHALRLTQSFRKLDRENVEKIISIFRAKLSGLAAPQRIHT